MKKLLTLAALSAALLSGCGWYTRIDPGYAGALVDYSQGQNSKPSIQSKSPGQWIWVDWVTQKITQLPVGQQTLTMVRKMNEGKQKGDDSISCQDSALVGLHVDISVMWAIDTAHVGDLYLLRPVGSISDLEDQVVRRDTRSIVPIACGQYTYEQIKATQRADFGAKVKELLAPKLAQTFIRLDDIAVGESYVDNKAIQDSIDAKAQAKIQAEQALSLKQKAENEGQANVLKATKEAEAATIKANNDAQVQVITAEADAKANELRRNSPTVSQQIELNKLQRWNGVLPQYEASDHPMVTVAAK